MTIDRDAAVQIAEQKVKTFEEHVGEPLDVVPLSEEKEGWIFGYDTRAYIETEDSDHALGGNAPFLVRRDNGSVVVFGTAHLPAHYLALYRAGRWYQDTTAESA